MTSISASKPKHHIMKIIKIIPFFLFALLLGCSGGGEVAEETSKYAYQSLENDPFGLRIYTLDNGLKVYISENHTEPRVQTNIAVRTGSKHDPADATGLAHYLEHMLFKGTSQIGSLDWEKEKPLLDLISDLYEQHRDTDDLEARKAIYMQIDSVSNLAADYVATNEYDKMISGLGAQGTNAYTSNERTVYINDVPSTELEKWLAIEAERFGELVLRLFHTELETVYEEFNRTQDSDRRQAYYKLMQMMYPTHPYGQQSTIGTGEHLKTPSMKKIHDYFNRRYAPNNMAVILAGDLNPDETIELVDKYFGSFAKREVEEMQMPKEEPITEPIVAEVTGSEAEFVSISFRLDGVGSEDALYVELLSSVLANGTAGLIDLNLNQSQKVLSGYAYGSVMEDYSSLSMGATAREEQTLDEVQDLLLAQLDSVKEGRFEEWMIDAVVRKAKKSQMTQMEYNWIRAYVISDAFILDQDWKDVVSQHDRMQAITKDQLVEWTKKTFTNNYVAVHKTIGEKNTHKVEKPGITPIEINREDNSSFYAKIDSMESMRLDPIFLNYSEDIDMSTVGSEIPFNYVQNEESELFYLYYVFDMGKNHNKQLPLAVDYLPYLGTNEMSPADAQKELFKLGVDFKVSTGTEGANLVLSGLEESLEAGVKFFENLLANALADEASYNQMVSGITKKRADAKLDKRRILRSGMRNYAQYGAVNPFNDLLSEEELRSIDPNALTDMLHGLTNYEHKILFYGPNSKESVKNILTQHHKVPEQLTPIPAPAEYLEIATDENKVYFCNYDMVQTELMMIHRGDEFNVELVAEANLFAQYFGAGLSSIVFQEIRESKALAYSAYAYYSNPQRHDDHHYLRGYIGTQADKLGDATSALLDLMSTMPKAEQQFGQAKISALKQIETNRTTGRNILWSQIRAKDLGLDYDLNSKVYPRLKELSIDDLESFFNENVKDRTYTYLVIGKREDTDMEALEALGPVKELSLEELFGY